MTERRFTRPAAVLALFLFELGRLPGAEVRVTLVPAQSSTPSWPAVTRIRAEAIGGTDLTTRAPAVDAIIRGNGETSLTLPPGLWRIGAVGDGLWVREEVLTVASAKHLVSLMAWPAGSLAGRLSLSTGHEPPREMRIVFQSAPGVSGPESVRKTQVMCPITGGRWICALPAGPIDVELRPEGYIPHYLWDVAIQGAQKTDVGSIALSEGASLAGWVRLENGQSPPAPCSVDVVPTGSTLKVLPRAESAIPPVVQTTVRGFFQIGPIEGGNYFVRAIVKGSEAAVEPIKVIDSVETILPEPLVLAPPAALDVYVDPPLDPWGNVWSIALVQLRRLPGSTTFHQEAGTGAAAPDGHWRKEGLSAGHYVVTVSKGLGDRWVSQEFDMASGGQEVFLHVPVVRIRGRVSRGDEPLRATLWFGGKRGVVSMELHSGEDGEFEGLLPRPGKWRVDIHVAELSIEQRVQVDVPGEEGARVDIEVPDTFLSGQVVDQRGRPVAGAMVGVASEDKQQDLSQRISDEDGRFEFSGVPSGLCTLWAETGGDLTSEKVPVIIPEGKRLPPVRLVLRAMGRIQGRVVSSGHSVSGARIIATPSDDPISIARPVWSDATGNFEFLLASGTKAVDLRVAAPGYAYHALRANVVPGEPITITLEETGGRLIIEMVEPPDPEDWNTHYVVVFHGGMPVGIHFLRQWGQQNGEANQDPHTLVVPNVDAGVWGACVLLNTDPMVSSPDRAPQGTCVTGTLTRGGDLVLKVPPPRR